jgi:hypothetical protein
MLHLGMQANASSIHEHYYKAHVIRICVHMFILLEIVKMLACA